MKDIQKFEEYFNKYYEKNKSLFDYHKVSKAVALKVWLDALFYYDKLKTQN